ncbi:MAG: hypothetical protein OEW63_05970 [Gammaproteobacteria bacterium]|nr:hypothetical protein [Gammaproteobacteria bacterium]
MLALSKRHQYIIGLLLVTLMAITRGHHFFTLQNLPSASWAIFFLAGFYLTGKSVFPLLLAEAALLDYIAITWGGVSSYCVSPAYSLLLPAYGALWLAGHWYASHYQFSWRTLLPLTSSVILATVICTVLSGGGFYFFSGRYAEPTFVEYTQRFSTYFPGYLTNMAFYVGLAAICHMIFVLTNRSGQMHQENHS